MANRVDLVVTDVVEAIRGALRKHEVTFDEYRQGVKYLMSVVEAKETPLILDLFFNSTIIEIEDRRHAGSRIAIEGPYFREGAPFVDRALKVLDADKACRPPIRVQGSVTDTNGAPVEAAVIDIWHSTADGRYGGVHDDLPIDIYRGKLRTDGNGAYAVDSLKPVPYHIPNQGPTGALLEKHMGRHSWRPAHIHFKVRKDGYKPLTTQAYFEGDDYLEDDCCEGVLPDLVFPERVEGGMHVLDVNFVLERTA